MAKVQLARPHKDNIKGRRTIAIYVNHLYQIVVHTYLCMYSDHTKESKHEWTLAKVIESKIRFLANIFTSFTFSFTKIQMYETIGTDHAANT